MEARTQHPDTPMGVVDLAGEPLHPEHPITPEHVENLSYGIGTACRCGKCTRMPRSCVWAGA
jgi:hypothetical protein